MLDYLPVQPRQQQIAIAPGTRDGSLRIIQHLVNVQGLVVGER